MKKIILVICLVLSVIMLACACTTPNDTDTDSSVNCDSQPDSNLDSTADSNVDSNVDSEVDVNDGKYRVFICDENGNGLKDIFVQYCTEEACYFGNTDVNGYLEVEDSSYHVASVIDESGVYESKEYAESEYVYFEAGSKVITITLTKK